MDYRSFSPKYAASSSDASPFDGNFTCYAYYWQGKTIVDEMADEIDEGRSLYTLDACMDPGDELQPAIGFWETNFKHMTERVSVWLISNVVWVPTIKYVPWTLRMSQTV